MGSRHAIAIAVVVLAMSLAAPAISAATQPEMGLGQAQPAPAPAPGTTRAAPATTLQAPPAPTLRATATASATASGASAVTIRDFSFNPNGVTVHAGDTVTWTNDGKVATGHTVSGKGFDSGVLHAGRSYSHTFSSPGTFSYICHIHPFMKGTVTVLASSSSAGSSPPKQSGTSGTTGSSTPTGTASSGGSLPMTGSDLWLLALTGLELAAAGTLLGRLLRS